VSRDPARAATQFFGGRVCLDFANTLDWRTSDEPQELIADYRAFITWSSRRGTLTARATANLKSRAAADPSAAEAVMAEALLLRAEIWKIADTLRERRVADLTTVNKMLAALPPQPRLLKQGNGYIHDLNGHELREPLWPVLWSLTAVLSSSDATRLGCCQAKGCGWFYVDESPNRTRMWCSSEVCGNRERARRAYAKRASTK
jgi:predicted RNA-binding Zn ribbon-like protein